MAETGDLEWWPAFMADEMMPRPEDSPSAWIREALGDKWLIAERVEDRDRIEPGEVSPLRQECSPGEIVDFISKERHGTIRVRLIDGRSFEAIDAVPAGANWFNIDGDSYACGHTLEDALAAELDDPSLYGEEVEVDCFTWSISMPHRFEVAEDGPRFVPVSRAAEDGEA